ncbi:hypothetical protein BJ138DRAFT_1019974 [Hygrophoropsis aurantiaca]|uniref:Uncharacterized protein n=1 Tax=Hygrophoropsis aurantiaca TaxID=72124 RepID=A0ACB7ZRZ0_9AGAM|nr:hypothetical protein BJ138DRAFT_1019974 [Hygrophoropsis aurantiaca]
MHQALLIEDIQLYILNQVEQKSDLSALARTCQAFTQVALDVLWRDLDCFIRLIQCMPPDLWSPQAVTEDTLCRPISSSDWTIFHKYSRRVHSIKLPFKDSTPITIDDSLMLALCTPPAPTPLLPNLTSLEWPIQSDAYLIALRRLVSSPLMSLRLVFSDAPSPSLHPESTLQIPFQKICPSLRDLAVEQGEAIYPPKILEELKQSISQSERS